MLAAEIERWNTAQRLLDEVLDAPGPKTVAFARTQAANTGCVAELEALLVALETDSALDGPLDEAIRDLAAPRMRHGALSGQVFGRWTLGEEIGRGGMSVVYRARRTGDGFEQEAALKILSLTFASNALIDSFLRERQILSGLQHPGIARLIDGGVTSEGSPFLVMEHVDGQRIDQWCRDNGPARETIVRLVLELARAVAYAQRHLVIHRDINASNVLVNERGQPVLIDFGIAGLLGTDSGRTLHAFTPTFAAPEQVAGERSTTATDVYAIGNLLGSLLAKHEIDNDLRLIVSVATAEDPEQRYANARSLADDLQAWLEKHPIRARPPSLRYRTGRFVARNRWGVAAAVLVLLSMLGGLAVSLWQATIAAQERDVAQAESARANQVTVFLKDLFRASDPDRAQGETVTARELLDLGAHQVRNAFEGSPALKAEMLVLLGDLYRELDELDAAEPLLQEALALAESQADLPAQVNALRALAHLEMEAQDHEGALALAERGEQLLLESGAVPGRQHANLMQPILFSLAETGRLDEAVERGQAALAAARSDPSLPPDALYNYLYDLANALNISKRHGDAEPLLLEARALDFEAASDPTVQMALTTSLASVADERGDIEVALNYQEQVNSLTRQLYPPGHPERARSLNNLAVSFNRLGRYPESELALAEVLDIYNDLYGEEAHPRVAAAHNNLGRVLQLQGEYEQALVHQDLARHMAGELFGTTDPRYAIATGNVGDLYRRLGQYDRAEELLVANLELRRSILGPDHRAVGTGQSVLALLRLEQGRFTEALTLTDEALALFARIDYTSPDAIIITRTRRARALAGTGRFEEAEAEFAQLLVLAEEAGANAGTATLDLQAAHARFLADRNDPRAEDAMAQALQTHRATLGAEHPDTLDLAAQYQSVVQLTD